MKVGLASFAFRWAFKAGLTLEGFLQQAADFGAEVVQLCENSGIERLGERELKDLADLARRLGIALECGGSGGHRDQMEAGIRRTASLGGTIYRCVLDSAGLTPEEATVHVQALLPLLEDCGVTLCAENHFRFSPQTLSRMIATIDHSAARVCLDPLNSIARWSGPEETVRELLPFARTAHVKDARIERAGNGWVISGAPLGEGSVDLAHYLATVAPKVESLLLESWMDPVDAEHGIRTLEQEADWARRGLAFIRKTTKRSRA
jgi:sugar phosphate isomerase/epimerase